MVVELQTAVLHHPPQTFSNDTRLLSVITCQERNRVGHVLEERIGNKGGIALEMQVDGNGRVAAQ